MKKFSVRKLEVIKTTAALYSAGCGGGPPPRLIDPFTPIRRRSYLHLAPLAEDRVDVERQVAALA